ncbi:hypothetical protein EV666_109105 [Camelimonas lactis]|uniref:Uncharacterized protein n=1 Tax=Camelimonas lactis TaxID=659006 RepID=A0A4R2GSK5_9HYPH|nr:hypothetical protein EV666_109105 [Camelimonas lactis]
MGSVRVRELLARAKRPPEQFGRSDVKHHRFFRKLPEAQDI